jgi:hypothetical protein
MARRLRLGTGLEVFDAWNATAAEADLKALGDALFAIVERTVYSQYPVIDDSANARELVVVVRDDLGIRVRLEDVDKFGIVFIGTPAAAIELYKTTGSHARTG